VLRGGKPVVARLGEDVVLVALPGDFDAESIPTTAQVLEAVPGGTASVVVDLAAVSNLDSATVTLLVNWADELSRAGGEVVVTTSDPRLERGFTAGGLGRNVRLERSLIEIVDAFGAASPQQAAG
jgi:anti-anti-sigma factor